jgi:hypothetical protein
MVTKKILKRIKKGSQKQGGLHKKTKKSLLKMLTKLDKINKKGDELTW